MSIGTVADTGYTVTFNGSGNIDQLTVTNPSAGVGGSATRPRPTASPDCCLSTPRQRSPGSVPARSTTPGFQVTFGGVFAGSAGEAALVLTNLTGTASYLIR